jgi:hypothetical protein
MINMRYNPKGVIAGLTGLALAGGLGLGAAPASASAVPVVYQDMFYQGAHVAPHGVAEAFGADAATYLITTRWSHWSSTSAHSTAGTVVWRSCWGSCMTHKSAPATQTLYVVRSHNGRHYFARVRVVYKYHGTHVMVATYTNGTWVITSGSRP